MKRSRNMPLAEADLDAITEYYSANNPAAGSRLLDDITAKCRQLANQPRQGRRRDEFGTGVRSVVVGQYVIFFRETATGIDVLRGVARLARHYAGYV